MAVGSSTRVRRLAHILIVHYDELLMVMAQEVFPAVYRNITIGMTLTQKRSLIIEYCQLHEAFNDLIRWVRQQNPTQYDRFLDRLKAFLPVTASLDRQLEKLQATYQQYERLIDQEENTARQTLLHQQAEDIRQEMTELEAQRASLLTPTCQPATQDPIFQCNVPYGLEMNPSLNILMMTQPTTQAYAPCVTAPKNTTLPC